MTSVWHRVAEIDELAQGEVKTVKAGEQLLALTHHEGQYGALAHRCPHMGGPLGEGSIEDGWLMCPWHGREFHPLSGACDHSEGVQAYPVEVREDGVYVQLLDE